MGRAAVDAQVIDRLHDRLRWPPVPGTVAGSLPVLFFGDLPAARVATVGLNPSWQEYLSPKGEELDGPDRRFETLLSLGAARRDSLSTAQAQRAVETMRRYFEPTRPVYRWFRPLEQVMVGFGASLARGQTAHLDLVQEATDPAWSRLRSRDRDAADRVLERDLAFLRWEIEAFHLDAIVCTSKTVMDHVGLLLDAEVLDEGTMERIRWKVGVCHVNGRAVGIAGWNLPLARPTGLGTLGHCALGMLLRERLGTITWKARP